MKTYLFEKKINSKQQNIRLYSDVYEKHNEIHIFIKTI